MRVDLVDTMLQDWARERAEVNADGLGVSTRISLLGKVLARRDKQALKPLGLAPWAAEVLLALRRQGPPFRLTPTDLRKLSLLTSGAMTTRLDRLEEAGLVQRSPDSDDRRSFQVTLTKRGRELADRAFVARLGMMEELLEPLSTAERTQAAGLLRKLLLASDVRPLELEQDG